MILSSCLLAFSDRSIICAEILLACVIKDNPVERSLGDPAFYAIVLGSSASKNSNRKRPQNKSSANLFTIPQNDPSEESKFQFIKDTADRAVLGK